jgi:hypothetical protein
VAFLLSSLGPDRLINIRSSVLNYAFNEDLEAVMNINDTQRVFYEKQKMDS